MIVDIEDANLDFEAISEALNELGDTLNVKIQIQHESIFQNMRRF